MSKKPKNLVSLNHLPGILLASQAECERWIEVGLIPVAARRRDGGRSAVQSADDAAHRRRQSILAPVRKNTGIYVAEDIRRIETGRWKPERVFAGYRAVFSQPMQILPDSAPIDLIIEFAFTEPLEVAAVALAP